MQEKFIEELAPGSRSLYYAYHFTINFLALGILIRREVKRLHQG